MNKFKFQLYLLITIISIILITFAINVFPTTGTDSRVFIPPALFYSKGLGFVNPLYNLTFLKGLYKDNSQFFQFNYYVPLFPLLTGAIGKIHPGIKTIFLICSLFSVTSLILYGKVIVSSLSAKTNIKITILALLSTVYIATYLLPTVGRPEVLSSLLAFIVYIICTKKGKINIYVYRISIFILLSLILSTQLICFYFCSLFIVIYDIIYNKKNIYKVLFINSIIITLAVLMFILILSLSPNGLLNTINGIRVHGTWALTRVDRSFKLFFYYWFLYPSNFGFLIIVLLCIFFYIKSLSRIITNLDYKRVFAIIILNIFVLLGVFKFIIYASPTVYNATQFIFPLSAYLISNISLIENRRIEKIIGSLTIITVIAGSVLFVRMIVLFADYKANKKDYDTAKIVINNLVEKNKTVRISSSLWSLLNNESNVTIFDGHYNSGDTVIFQQVYRTDIDYYLQRSTIIYDWRISGTNKFLGISLGNSPQCYSFIVCKMN